MSPNFLIFGYNVPIHKKLRSPKFESIIPNISPDMADWKLAWNVNFWQIIWKWFLNEVFCTKTIDEGAENQFDQKYARIYTTFNWNYWILSPGLPVVLIWSWLSRILKNQFGTFKVQKNFHTWNFITFHNVLSKSSGFSTTCQRFGFFACRASV